MSNIRRQQAICRSAELGAAALAIAPDPAVTPGAQEHHQHCQILSLVHGYEDPSEADAEAVAVLLYRLGMARMVELINRANDERKPELREPVLELVA
jgi:hypothetical protein